MVDLVIVYCLQDKSGDHYIMGQIIKLPLEYLRRKFVNAKCLNFEIEFSQISFWTEFENSGNGSREKRKGEMHLRQFTIQALL